MPKLAEPPPPLRAPIPLLAGTAAAAASACSPPRRPSPGTVAAAPPCPPPASHSSSSRSCHANVPSFSSSPTFASFHQNGRRFYPQIEPVPQHSRAPPSSSLPLTLRSIRLRIGNYGHQRGRHGGAQARVPSSSTKMSGRECTCRPSATWSRTSAAVSSSGWTTSATTTLISPTGSCHV